jgi:hypothetical protein
MAMQGSPLHSSLLAIEMRELLRSGEFESGKEDRNHTQVSLLPNGTWTREHAPMEGYSDATRHRSSEQPSTQWQMPNSLSGPMLP